MVQRSIAVSVVAAIVSASAAAHGQTTVVDVEWLGRPVLDGEGNIVRQPGGANWFNTGWFNPSISEPWTQPLLPTWSGGEPFYLAPQYATTNRYAVTIGADRGVAPTAAHVVTTRTDYYPTGASGYTIRQFSSYTPDMITLERLTIGTDYVLRIGASQSNEAASFLERGVTLTGTGAGALVNNGRIEVLSRNWSNDQHLAVLRPAHGSTITGRGTIRLGGEIPLTTPGAYGNGAEIGLRTNPNLLATAPAQRGFGNGAGHTIEGYGTLIQLRENDGIIRANVGTTGGVTPSMMTIQWATLVQGIAGQNIQTVPLGKAHNRGTVEADKGRINMMVAGHTDVINTGTIQAINGGWFRIGIGSRGSFINEGIVEANGVGSRVILDKMPITSPSNTGTFQFTAGHKPRALNGGVIEARNWSLRPEDIDFVGTGNTFAVTENGTFTNTGQTYSVPAGLTVEVGDGGTLSGGTFDNTQGGGAIVVPAGQTGTVENATVNGTVVVEPGATLALAGTVGGTFTAGGDVSVTNGATLSPGNSPGTVTILGDLTLAAGGGWRIELGQGAAGDRIEVGGLLDLSAANNTLELVGGTLGETYTIATFTGINGGFESVTGNGQYDAQVVGNALQITVVPEPAVATLAMIGAVGLVLRRRRRRYGRA